MKKKNNIIVINGRQYDAKTGETLSHHTQTALHASPKPAGHQAASQTAPSHKTVRPPAAHLAAHQQKPTRTLMRQGVSRPSETLKRRIKVQGHMGTRDEHARHSRIISHPPAKQAATPHVRHPAVKGNKSQLISHFSPDLFKNVDHREAIARQPQPAPARSQQIQPVARRAVPLYKKPRTTAELLEYAIQQADGPQAPLALPKSHRKLFKRHARPATV